MKKKLFNFQHPTLEKIARFYIPMIKYLLFWQIYFQLLRLVFFIYHSDKIFPIKPIHLFKTFWYGIHADLTFTSYMMVLPVLVFFIQLFFKKIFYRKLLLIYSSIMVVITAIIALIDMELYASWGFKINKEFLFYLQFPKEALASVSLSFSLVLFSIIYLFSIVIILRKFNKKIVSTLELPLTFSSVKDFKPKLLIVVFFAAIVAVGARGGTNLAPFNPSYVYFSNRPFLNHTALNASWNLTYSAFKKSDKLSYSLMPEEEHLERFDNLYASTNCDSALSILKLKQPNVVLVILEGWTADIVENLGGVKGVSPNFDTLIQEGLLFTNFYASGDRTYKGVPAILSGFPAIPLGSVIKYTSKMEQLPSISKKLNDKGYSSSFLYGGELSFANIRAYIQHCGYHKVIDKFHFLPSEYQGSKWGIHDHLLFDRTISELSTEKGKFFTTILTQSSHEPYTVPMETKFEGTDRNEQFKNAAYYTDKSLGEFMQQAKKQSWYDNTLFIFLADHGKNLPMNRENWSPEMFKIPLLFYGEALKNGFKGEKISKYGSQTDLAASLLKQLKLESSEFDWSNNLFSCSKDFAFYNYSGGFGWLTPKIELVYDLKSDRLFFENDTTDPNTSSEELKNGKAYMQQLTKKFNEM